MKKLSLALLLVIGCGRPIPVLFIDARDNPPEDYFEPVEKACNYWGLDCYENYDNKGKIQMSDEQEASICKILIVSIAAFLCILSGSIAHCNMESTKLETEMLNECIAAGNNPVDCGIGIRCATGAIDTQKCVDAQNTKSEKE